ncbi:MAG: hypothetical protein IKE74_05505 [Mogibacterium sp.]|nr:hypothetical protein [Mogibacterium sp.]
MKRILSILSIFMMIACMPINVDATSFKVVPKKTTVAITWDTLSASQQRAIDGIAIVRDNKVVKTLKKNATSYTDKKLKPGAVYKYQIKTYKFKKQTKWYNKKTKKWQTKKPPKKIRGKSKKVKVRKYKKTLYTRTVRTRGSNKNSSVTSTKSSNTSTNPSTQTEPNQSGSYFYAPTIYSAYACEPNVDNPYISIFWYGVPDAYGYKVYRDNKVVKTFDSSVTGYTDRNVGWAETHTYVVSAFNNEGIELFSISASATTPNKAENKCTVEYANAHGEWLNVSDAYTVFNDWRMNPSNQWYLIDDSETGRVTLNSADVQRLERDPALEEVAKLRAKEQWIQYFVNNIATHDRPNGKSFITAYKEAGVNLKGENLAWNNQGFAARQIIEDSYDKNGNWITGWAETPCSAGNQGHRRVMLLTGSQVTKVGIACFRVGDMDCWAMAIGY